MFGAFSVIDSADQMRVRVKVVHADSIEHEFAAVAPRDLVLAVHHVQRFPLALFGEIRVIGHDELEGLNLRFRFLGDRFSAVEQPHQRVVFDVWPHRPQQPALFVRQPVLPFLEVAWVLNVFVDPDPADRFTLFRGSTAGWIAVNPGTVFQPHALELECLGFLPRPCGVVDESLWNDRIGQSGFPITLDIQRVGPVVGAPSSGLFILNGAENSSHPALKQQLVDRG